MRLNRLTITHTFEGPGTEMLLLPLLGALEERAAEAGFELADREISASTFETAEP